MSAEGLIGRDIELAAVESFVAAEPAERSALVLQGEAGIGKTTIVRAAVELAAEAGLRVFAARPSAAEEDLPYAALGDLVAGVGGEALAALPGPQRAALDAALRRTGSSAGVDTFALAKGLLEVLRHEAAAGDLVLVLDDAQWLDRPTSQALTYACRRLAGTPLRLVASARTEPDGPASLPLGLEDWEYVQQVHVGPMPVTDLGALIRRELGRPLPRPRLEELHRVSRGNPLFAVELARTDRPEASLPAALRERISGLDPGVRATLAVAGLAVRPTPEQIVAAGIGRDQLQSTLLTGLLRLEGERLSFAHPLLGPAAVELVLPAERREIHERLAAASADVVERGWHVGRAATTPDEDAAASLELAADEAARRGDHAGSAGLLQRATELTPETGSREAQRREVGAALALAIAGDVDTAVDRARELVARLPPGVPRAKARRLLVDYLSNSELTYDIGLDELGRALDDARDDLPVTAELHVALAELCAGAGRLEDAVSHAQRALEHAKLAGADDTAVVALSELALAECMLGHGVTDHAREAYARWDQAMPFTHTYSPRMVLASTLLYTEAFDDAVSLLADEQSYAEEHGLEIIEVIARGLTAEAQLRRGRWADALANARIAVEHARQATMGQIVTGASYALAMAQALLGRHDEARAIAAQGVADSEERGDFWFTLHHRAVLGLVALAEDDPESAADVLEPAWELMLERGLGELSIFPVAHVYGEALVALGRLEETEAVASRLRTCPAGERPWCRAMAARLDALVASARGDHDRVLRQIAAALDAHLDLPEPFEHARTLQIAGRLERSARRWGAARASFVEAHRRFDELGAARWAEHAASDIARLPGRRPGDPQALTARERDVAELAGRGLTNKEIAARLYISVYTVEANLSKAYAKLGVRSRAELAGRLAAIE